MATSTYTLPPLPARHARLSRNLFRVTDDVAGMTTLMVNVFLVGRPGSAEWALVDAGLPGYGPRIVEAATERFGNVAPQAIVLTHGHFDHVGSLRALLERWPDTTVYAHAFEFPFLTGRASYPPPDPFVGGGMLARTSSLLPRRPIDVSTHLVELPQDGKIPGLPGWRWIHTPGHTVGHVSLYREEDGTLLPGDAFCTQRQESLTGVLTRAQAIHGPPAYFTTDWKRARDSVRKLTDLRAVAAAPSHGLPLYVPRLQQDLEYLLDNFDRVATPRDGRYVREPVRHDAIGNPTYVPPPTAHPLQRFATTMGLVAIVAGAAYLLTGRDED